MIVSPILPQTLLLISGKVIKDSYLNLNTSEELNSEVKNFTINMKTPNLTQESQPFSTHSPMNEIENALTSSQLSYAINTDRPIDTFQGQESCIKLIEKMLTKNPRKRISVDDILKEEWFIMNKDKVNYNIRDKGYCLLLRFVICYFGDFALNLVGGGRFEGQNSL